MKFKKDDWVVVSGRFETFTTKYYKELNEEYNNPSIKLWKPKEGDWIVPRYQGENSFSVLKWGKRYEGTSYELCEPFIGELPTFTKEKQCK